MREHPARRPLRAVVAGTAALALAIGGAVGLGVAPALADTVITVNDHGDGAAPACSDSGYTSLAGTITLREALCLADNYGTATVVVPPGNYGNVSGAGSPTGGNLEVGSHSGVNVTIQAQDPANKPVIGDFGPGSTFEIDLDLVGGTTVTLTNLVFKSGTTSEYGGAAIIDGSGLTTAASDVLHVSGCDFVSNAVSGSATNTPGGAIQFIGGSLTVSDSTFTTNDAGSSEGGAVYYQASAVAPSQTLSIMNSTFSGNKVGVGSVTVGGGAIAIVDGSNAATMSISGSTFAGNTLTAGAAAGRGGAIRLESGILTVATSAFTSNTGGATSGNLATGGAIQVESAAKLVAHNDRFYGNGPRAAVVVESNANAGTDFSEEWWGCNAAANSTGCDKQLTEDATQAAAPTATASSTYLKLVVSGAPATAEVGDTFPVTATLQSTLLGAPVGSANTGAFEGASVGFTATATSTSSAMASGSATGTYTAPSTGGTDTLHVTLDGADITTTIAIEEPLAFTSADSATFTVGSSGSAPVTVSGFPHPTVTVSSGSLPAGLTLSANGTGSETISGTPTGAGGTTVFTLEAQNSSGSVFQDFTATVYKTPVFGAPSGSLTFTVGSAGSYGVSATGYGTPTISLDPSSTLPTGVTFTPSGSSATLSGTPAAGTGGTYPVRFVATGSSVVNDDETLTVDEAPTITSAASATFLYDDAASTFTVTTGHAFPIPTFTAGSGLPTGVTFHDNLDGTATISGAPEQTGSFSVSITASNGVSPDATQTFALTVNAGPTVTADPSNTSAVVGDTASFSAAATGTPTPTVQWQVSTDSGANWDDVPGATDTTLTVTAALADDGNEYHAVFTNVVSSATSAAATLSVGTAPGISLDSAATAYVGQLFTQEFSASGTPHPSFTVVGTLPSWLTLTDNGDGTGTLTGTPGAADASTASVELQASNGFGSPSTATIVITIAAQPTIAGSTHLYGTVGQSFSEQYTASGGFPTTVAMSLTGTLPAGLASDGTTDNQLTISGTPTAPGEYTGLEVTADNGLAAPVVESIQITVYQVVVITSPNTATFVNGVNKTVTITTTTGYPTATVITLPDALPAGLSFHDNGDGTATISGTPTGGASSTPVTVTAANSPAGSVDQALTITVVEPTAVPLPPSPPSGAASLIGVPSSAHPGDTFTVSGTGFAPNAPVTLGIYSSPVTLASVTADATGAFTTPVTVPTTTPVGAHTIVAIGMDPDADDLALSANIRIVAAATPLANTGIQPEQVALIALALAFGGFLAFAIALLMRRRRRV